MTVPCCETCNNGYSREDEFFRLVTTLGVHKTPEKELVYHTRTVARTLARGRLRSEITALLSGMKREWKQVNGVMIYAGLVRLPVELIRRVSIRIAQGMLAYHHPLLPTHFLNYDAYVQPEHGKILEIIADLGTDLTELRLGGRTFHAYHGTVPGQPSYGVVLMCFHETITAAVFHFPDGQTSHVTNRI